MILIEWHSNFFEIIEILKVNFYEVSRMFLVLMAVVSFLYINHLLLKSFRANVYNFEKIN